MKAFNRFTIFFLSLGLSLILLALMGTGCGRELRGKDGAPGPQGEVGAKGDPGIDAQPWTVVKLCPGVTVYPSRFTEVAFCIQGKLYGTYSANGGFSTELPPGSYGSNGINSSCNFLVLPNCGIRN